MALCQCSAKADPGYKSCSVCRKKNNESARRSSEKKRRLGLCLWCGKKAPGRKRLCVLCRKKSSEFYKKRNKRLHRQKRCSRCGTAKPPRGRRTCDECNDYMLSQQQERKKKGLCGSCSNKARPGKWSCQKCYNAQKTSYKKNKEEVVAAYGGKCNCCGETEISFLCIDHVNGNGSRERKRLGYQGAGPAFYRRLKRLGYPKRNYQLLCMNCNASKHLLGECAHKRG